MVGSSRPLVLGLALGLSALATPTRADDPPRPSAPAQEPAGEAKAAQADPFGPQIPPEFVPLRPRTAEDRADVEAMSDYAAARALERTRRLSDAITLLEEALQKEPGSAAILRRLALLNRARGKTDKAAEYARQVLDADPGDTDMLSFLVAHHLQKNDAAAVESLLKSVLNNPELEKASPAYLLAARDLGELYERVNNIDKAADAFAKLLDALDEKATNRLNPVDLRRILGDDPAGTYGRLGLAFAQAKRYGLAVRAFERGLGYEPEHPLLPRILADSQLKAGHPQEALDVLEPYLKRQPAGREAYDLLAETLDALGKKDQVIPRLEAAVEANPKNLAIKNVLADRYRAAGEVARADAIYKDLIANQSGPEAMGALAASLLNDRKTDELIKLLGEAIGKPGGYEAIRPQLDAIVKDKDYAGQILDAGMKQLEDDPATLSDGSRKVLLYIGTQAELPDRVIAFRKRLVEKDPTVQNYRELVADLLDQKRWADLADALAGELKAHPDQKNAQNLYMRAKALQLSGQYDQAIEGAREALKLDPNDYNALETIGSTLAQMGKNDEAIAHFEDMLKQFADDDASVIRIRSNLSIIYVNMDKMQQGEEQLEKLLEKYPDDPGVNNDLGYLYADRGKNLEQAEKMIRKAVEAEPDRSAYLDSLGWVLFRQGKPKQAAEYLEKAAEAPEVDATILDHLGDAYFQLKDYAKARTTWEKAESAAKQTTPPDKRLVDIRKKLDALNKLGRSGEATGENP